MTFYYISLTQVCLKYIFSQTKVISRYSKDGKTSFTYVPLRIISFFRVCQYPIHT